MLRAARKAKRGPRITRPVPWPAPGDILRLAPGAPIHSGTATATLSLDAGAEAAFYTIVVADRFANDPGTGFTVEVQCYAVC